LVKASFVPPAAVGRLKDLVRARTGLARMRGQEFQRLEKVLEDAAVKLSSVISRLDGASGRRMLEALIRGERDPVVLACLGDSRLKATPEVLVEALTGRFTDHHGLLARVHLDVVDCLTGQIGVLDRQIEEFFTVSGDGDGPGGLSRAEREDWAAKRDLLATVPGIGKLAAEQILAEVGPDMSVFPTSQHFVSWAGVAPGMNQSAGRSKSAACPKGDAYLKAAVGNAALCVALRPGTFLHARYRRVCSHRGPSRALVAVERSILTSVWHILTTGEPYRELGPDYYLRQRPGAVIRKAVDQLRKVGFDVNIHDAPAPTAVITRAVPAT
jgi:transposase